MEYEIIQKNNMQLSVGSFAFPQLVTIDSYNVFKRKEESMMALKYCTETIYIITVPIDVVEAFERHNLSLLNDDGRIELYNVDLFTAIEYAKGIIKTFTNCLDKELLTEKRNKNLEV